MRTGGPIGEARTGCPRQLAYEEARGSISILLGFIVFCCLQPLQPSLSLGTITDEEMKTGDPRETLRRASMQPMQIAEGTGITTRQQRKRVSLETHQGPGTPEVGAVLRSTFQGGRAGQVDDCAILLPPLTVLFPIVQEGHELLPTAHDSPGPTRRAQAEHCRGPEESGSSCC